jgi:regulator of RNase E activity RraB
MGFFDLFSSKPKRFVSEGSFRNKRAKQIKMTPMTLAQLRKVKVTKETELKLEYFFYTDSSEKAASLAADLKAKGYDVESRTSVSDKKEQLITGWTSKMLMSESVVLTWTKEMCELGFSHDCDFDGWGTTPKQ